MISFKPRFSCELLKWDVRMLVSLESICSEYRRAGMLNSIASVAFDYVESLILGDLRSRCFSDAMHRYRSIQSKHMDGSSDSDFIVSNIMQSVIAMAFPNEQPGFFFNHLAPWDLFTLFYFVPDGTFGEIEFWCKDKDDAFDMVLSCCIQVPDDNPNRQWIVQRLLCGPCPLTDEFYNWALPMLPEFMVEAREKSMLGGVHG